KVSRILRCCAGRSPTLPPPVPSLSWSPEAVPKLHREWHVRNRGVVAPERKQEPAPGYARPPLPESGRAEPPSRYRQKRSIESHRSNVECREDPVAPDAAAA